MMPKSGAGPANGETATEHAQTDAPASGQGETSRPIAPNLMLWRVYE
jgi:hypothetical protein